MWWVENCMAGGVQRLDRTRADGDQMFYRTEQPEMGEAEYGGIEG